MDRLPIFLGRERELERLAAMYESGDWLVTVLGSAGVGKTRLAARFSERFEGKKVFCDLGQARDLEGMLSAVARAIDVPLPRGPIDSMIAQLGDALPARSLVVLDNCEQCVSDVARVLTQWSGREIRFLATSREVLHVRGERVFDLAPLSEEHGVALFALRARLVRPEFSMNSEDEKHIAAIVRHLDGLPLAIELAAARIGILSPRQIQSRLDLDFLSSAERNISERQRTLRGAIEWSWQLLSEHERSALAQCSIFAGPFPIEAAEGVLALPKDAPSVLDALQALRDKSLLRSFEPPEQRGETWLTMFESIREYARERLGDDEAIAKAHLAYFSAPIDRERISLLRDDIMAAHAHALEVDDIPSAACCTIALERVALDHGPHSAYETMVQACLERADDLDDPMRARLLLSQSFLRMLAVDRQNAASYGRMAAEIAARLGDSMLELRALQVIGQIAAVTGDDEQLDRTYARVLSLVENAKDKRLRGLALMQLGLFLVVRGKDLARAHEHLVGSVACLREVGDDHRLATSYHLLGAALEELGKLEDAREMYERAVETCHASHDRFREACSRANLAGVHLQEGRFEPARSLAEQSVQAFTAIGDRWQRAFGLGILGGVLARQGDIEASTRALDQAESDLATMGDDLGSIAVRIYRGLNDLARAHAASDSSVAATHRARASSRLRELGAHPTDDARFAARILRRALREDSDFESGVTVAADGAWFRIDGQRVELGARKNLRLIVKALAEKHAVTPGVALDAHALFEAAWPGEKVLHDAALNRVRVAMNTLRRLGLRDLVRSDGEGYLFDPQKPLTIV